MTIAASIVGTLDLSMSAAQGKMLESTASKELRKGHDTSLQHMPNLLPRSHRIPKL